MMNKKNIEIERGTAIEKMWATATFTKNRIQLLEELENYDGTAWQNTAAEVEKGIAKEKLKLIYKELRKQYDQYFPNVKQGKEVTTPQTYSEKLAPYAFRLQIHKYHENTDKIFADVDFLNDEWMDVRHAILEAITYLGEGETQTNVIVASDLLMNLPSLATAIWLLQEYNVPFVLYNEYNEE